MARLDRLQLVSRRTVVGQRRGERKSLRKGIGNEFADYRNYAPGDDLRFLDWKADLMGSRQVPTETAFPHASAI